ncbi:recombinase family protein [Salmonella enterica]|nr:recombinase family protein [Salmonella enterica]EEO4608495.1 recombinase family protein [Salmonella enterica]
MSRLFAYCRVSTTEQTTENQIHAISERGYTVEPHRVVSETVSGSVPASEREGFQRLIERLEPGDQLVVLKLDRLGRDSIDVQQTIDRLIKAGIVVHCLDLPIPNLSSSEGRLMLQMFAAFAEFERNRIRERTKEALNKRKADGVRLGRPEATTTTTAVQKVKGQGLSQSEAAKALGLGIATIKRHWNKS